ncbi:hypothetical protein [Oceanivirga salmonicida]|uniref:hypothetical protein n=1 Tax=Oceanivirga salmonicida TaxID=1769291 RepID=UPI00083099F2|nr:hypothetical protein [Oceanivirga salmonicida]
MKKKLFLIITLVLTSLSFSKGGESEILVGIAAGIPSAHGAVNLSWAKKFNPSQDSYITVGGGIEAGGGVYVTPDLNVVPKIKLSARVIPYGFVNPYLKLEAGGSVSNQTILHSGVSVGYIHTFGNDKSKLNNGRYGEFDFPGLSTRLTFGGTNKTSGVTGEFGVTAVFVKDGDNFAFSLPNSRISIQLGKKLDF